jgi:hypothetical protein
MVLHDEIIPSQKTPQATASTWVDCLLKQLEIDGFSIGQSSHEEGNSLVYFMDIFHLLHFFKASKVQTAIVGFYIICLIN